MKKNLRRSVSLFLSLILLAMTVSQGSQNQLQQEHLRIGLLTLYTNKDSLLIKNQALHLGYFREGLFETMTTLSSTEGFTITPFNGVMYVSTETYSDYANAKARATALSQELSTPVIVGLASFGTYKLYLLDTQFWGTGSDPLAQMFVETADNGESVKVAFGNGEELVLENTDMRASFMPVADALTGLAIVDLGDRKYRGALEVSRYQTQKVSGINLIGLDDYLFGVLPGEVPSSWPAEALKAQAVAARSFAYYHAYEYPKYPNMPYDLGDDVNSQVYKGFGAEALTTNNAVTATTREVILYNQQVIPAFFFSSSGGHTENSELVWSGTVPYLKGVVDFYERMPTKQPWVYKLTPAEVKEKLAVKGVDIGDIVGLQVIGYTDAGRAMTLKVIGSTGEYDLIKETMRSWLGINSRKFTLIDEHYKPVMTHFAVNAQNTSQTINYQKVQVMTATGTTTLLQPKDQVIVLSANNQVGQPMITGEKNVFTFVGQGWGHGVGMSQTGARGMADAGFSYRSILTYYYTGTQIGKK